MSGLSIREVIITFILSFSVLWLFLFFLVQSKTGALEGPEVDGFVKDMMELVRVSVCSFVMIMV